MQRDSNNTCTCIMSFTITMDVYNVCYKSNIKATLSNCNSYIILHAFWVHYSAIVDSKLSKRNLLTAQISQTNAMIRVLQLNV